MVCVKKYGVIRNDGRFFFFRSLKVLLHLLGTFELYYRARIYVGRAFFFFSSPRVSYYDSVQHAHPALKKEPNKFSRRRNLFFFFFFFGSWSQPTLLQLLALHFHGRLDRINRPLYILSAGLGLAQVLSNMPPAPLIFLAQQNITSVALSLDSSIRIHL